MQFHHYRNAKNHFQWIAKNNSAIDGHKQRRQTRSLTAAHSRKLELGRLEKMSSTGDERVRYLCDHEAMVYWGEENWVKDERPYYNVWPIAIEMARSVELDLPFAKLPLPNSTLLLRFPVGREPYGLTVALLRCYPYPDYEAVLHLTAYGKGFDGQQRRSVFYRIGSDSRVQDYLEHLLCQKPEFNQLEEPQRQGVDASQLHEEWCEAYELLVRLMAFIGLLAGGRDVITPIVLSKDRKKYDQTDDPNVKQQLEDRAANRIGRGFDLGKKLEKERAASVHWRNAHACLFWTGKGRNTPIIKIRRGGVVSAAMMTDVPTGYLGPEMGVGPQSEIRTP